MSHTKNKIEWCLKKAERELKESGKQRGLVKGEPDLNKAKGHIAKAEHYFNATEYLKEGGFTEISASTIFYSMYHCLLAIAAKFGYESGNQECTFALISGLIEDQKIEFEKALLDRISSLDVKYVAGIKSIVEIREQYQYGTALSLGDNLYDELLSLAKEVILTAKLILKK
ncbi:HEPN domain-containing protein [Candidatus Woesearchaeota archaeon]|nr:HEPN domain-containing protein [Candidatus Woesearchaeota archaeon]